MDDRDPLTPETLPTRIERPRRAAAARRVATGALPEGATLGRYRILRWLGSGGMGSVYAATHLEMGKSVALKVLRQDATTDAQARARFLREAATASRIRHPHVVNVTDFGSEADLPFIVMQLLRGEDLGDRLDRNPRGLAVKEVVDVMLAVCAGVVAAHGAGVIHRDLKPKNIFLARLTGGEISPTVLDFGISTMEDRLPGAPLLTEPGTLLGTTHYLSPEQVIGRPADARTDQHALGVILYECLVGQRPYEGETPQAVRRNIETGRSVRPTRLRPDLPPEVEAAVLRAMAHDPAARFSNVHDLGTALLPFASLKKQVAWGDYYGRATRPVPSAVGVAPPSHRSQETKRLPAPGSSQAMLQPVSPTEMLAVSRPPASPLSHTLERPPPAPARPDRTPTPVSERFQDSVAPGSPGASRAEWFLRSLAALMVLATAVRLLVRIAGPDDAPVDASPAAESALTASPAVVTPPPQPVERHSTPPAAVTIQVPDARPNLAAQESQRTHPPAADPLGAGNRRVGAPSPTPKTPRPSGQPATPAPDPGLPGQSASGGPVIDI